MDQGGGTVVKQMSVIHDQDQAARPGPLRDSPACLAKQAKQFRVQVFAGRQKGGERPIRKGSNHARED